MFSFTIHNITLNFDSNVDLVHRFDEFTIDDLDFCIDLKQFINFVEISYYIDLFIPDKTDDILHKIDDYFSFITISFDQSKNYYYSCLLNILIQSYKHKKFNEIKNFLIEYMDNQKDFDIDNYLFLFYFLKYLNFIDKKTIDLKKNKINYSMFDYIYDNNI